MRKVVYLSSKDIDLLNIDRAIKTEAQWIEKRIEEERSHVECSVCKQNILPGRAGRMCKTCRETPQT